MCGLKPVDLLCLAYLMLIVILIFVGQTTFPYWKIHALLHLILIVSLIFFVSKMKDLISKNIFLFIRTFYPVAIIIFSWIELRHLRGKVTFLLDLTPIILKTEDYLFGLDNLDFFRKSSPPWLKEIFSFFYLSYYLYLPAATIPFYLKKRYALTASIIFLVTLIYLSNFLFFYLFPSLSPNYLNLSWSKNREEDTALFLSSLIDFIQEKEGVRGAAFPSSHLSAATGLTLSCWRYRSPFALVLSVFLPLIALAAINLGYHHAIDCLTGLLMGGLFYWLGLKILKKQEKKNQPMII
ncbi:MAG: phosphatase PAP2 family protein [Candidatus Aminicenantes bacterium]|nr:phosphatase PAP2 family protein [Candidatus Aminicenantes bacterium]